MPKPGHTRNRFSDGFTLIEIMVAVVIIAVVIAALLQIFSNNTRLIGTLADRVDITLRSSLLLGIGDRGFENKHLSIDTLIEDFEVDGNLKNRMKSAYVDLTYHGDLQLSDPSASPEELSDDMEDTNQTGGVFLEIGRTTLVQDDTQVSLLRLRLQ